MSLLFVGIDPNTGDKQSPTVWVDQKNKEIVFQGWKAGAELESECAACDVPGHAKGIPEGEAVVRIPARMAHWNHFAGDGSSTGEEITDDPAAARLCAAAFEEVWSRAVPHERYEIR